MPWKTIQDFAKDENFLHPEHARYDWLQRGSNTEKQIQNGIAVLEPNPIIISPRFIIPKRPGEFCINHDLRCQFSNY